MLLWCGMGPHLYGKFFAIFPTAECMGLLHGVVWVLVISVPQIPVLHISSGASWINCFSTRETEEKFLRAGPGRLLGSLLTMDLIVSRELFHPSVLFDAWVHHWCGLGWKNKIPEKWRLILDSISSRLIFNCYKFMLDLTHTWLQNTIKCFLFSFW